MNPSSILAMLLRRPEPVVGATPAAEVHRENKWRLLRYRARPEGLKYQTPVLLVPSLINRHYVLDLMPGKSFTEYLVAAGHDVYCIDWGIPGDEDRFLEFDTYCDNYIGRALRIAAKSSPRGKAHVLGYCLGGTLATIHVALRPERAASLLALAAPIRFHDEGLLSKWTNTKSFDLKAIVDAYGNVPWQMMQSSFQLLRPTLQLSKAVSVLDKAWDNEYLDGFLALDTWGNDNISFAGACYEKYVRELYRNDALVKGELVVSGKVVRLQDIHCPVLAVTFQHDNIVPQASAAELTVHVGALDNTCWTLPGGHVGAVVSKSAARGLWPKMSAFWAERDSEPAAPAA